MWGLEVTITCVNTSIHRSCLKKLPLLKRWELYLLFPVGIISPFYIW